MGPRGVLDAVMRKIPSSRRESNPRTPIVQPVAQSLYRLSYHGSGSEVNHMTKHTNGFDYFVNICHFVSYPLLKYFISLIF
jgi:hypothetical protein